MNYATAVIVVLAIGLLAGTLGCPGSVSGPAGIGDVCYDDTDDDGFLDSVDSDAFDRDNPGDFSSPEAILSNVIVQMVIDVVRTRVDINFNLGVNPPLIDGSYRFENCDGRFIATGNTVDEGVCLCGSEWDIQVREDLVVERHGRSLCSGEAARLDSTAGLDCAGIAKIRGIASLLPSITQGLRPARVTEVIIDTCSWV